MMMRGLPLDEEQAAKRIACWEAGMNVAEAAGICGCTTSALKAWCRKRGYPPSRFQRKNGIDREELEKMRKLRESGYSISRLHREFGYDDKTIVVYLNGKGR